MFTLLFSNTYRTIAVGARRNAKKLRNAGILAGTTGGTLLMTAATVNASSAVIRLEDEEEGLNLDDFMSDPITALKELEQSEEMMHKMEVLCMKLQAKLCREVERIEGTEKFRVDRWLKCEGIQGGGITCIMEEGAVFERAGVNISVVAGKLRPAAVKAMNSQGRELPEDEEMKFSAVGISSVIHPRNPMVPTKHFNFRYFEVQPEFSEKQWWFGGGADLTPYYLNEKDAKHFHCAYKAACELHGPSYYKRFKKWCDDYFYIPHRCIRRGVGGIFFDDFKSNNQDASFNFVKSCSEAVIPSYIPIVEEHMNDGYGIREREWQLFRRGQYVEFNLLYDRGTKFGFNTPGARHESILMSLPSRASWKYCHEPEAGSPEAKLVEVLRNPVDWVNL